MRKYVNGIIYLTAEVSLVVSLMMCFTTAFNINIHPASVILPTALVGGLVLVSSALLKSRGAFWGAVSAFAVVYAALVLFTLDDVLQSLSYTINCVLKYYAAAFPMPTSVQLSKATRHSAAYFLALLATLLSGVISVALFRARRFFPVILVSLAVLVPCFLVVDTVPERLPLMLSVAILISLYLSGFLRRKSFDSSGFVLLPAIAVMLCVSLIICNIFPQKKFERFDWQEKLLTSAEQLTGIQSSRGQGALASVRHEITDVVNLNQLNGPEQTHARELMIYAEGGGDIYLKAISYANFKDNQWSILTDEQEAALPQSKNLFIAGDLRYLDTRDVMITTNSTHEFAYVPYFADSLPDAMSGVDDVLVRNTSKLLAYDFKCYVDPQPEDYAVYSAQYGEYVFRHYTQLPEDTQNALREIALHDSSLSRAVDSGDSAEIVAAVQKFVSSRGEYSLDCDIMPEGEDLPVWFLTKAQKGFCVHYATAAAAMLRALGVPARYASGYYATAKQNAWTTVTTDNAHAWAEYYDSRLGWVPLEATPPDFSPVMYEPEATDSTESATVAATSPSTAPTQPAKEVRQAPASRLSGGTITAVAVISTLFLSALAIMIRAAIIKRLRKAKMKSGSLNSRAVHTYRYLEQLRQHNIVPEEMEHIAWKARFSEHQIDRSELKRLTEYMESARLERYQNSSGWKRLYDKYIKAI